jgi:hypothetical protein
MWERRTFFVITKLVPGDGQLAHVQKGCHRNGDKVFVPMASADDMANASPMYLQIASSQPRLFPSLHGTRKHGRKRVAPLSQGPRVASVHQQRAAGSERRTCLRALCERKKYRCLSRNFGPVWVASVAAELAEKKSVVCAKARSGWGLEVAVARRGGGGNRGQRMKSVAQEE